MGKIHGNGRVDRDRLLGMSFGTARSQLSRLLLFDLVTRCDLNWCHRCGVQIETLAEFSIEHTEEWQSAASPVAVFFDVSKIGYSHRSCNSVAANKRRWVVHGSAGYKRGCRCHICSAVNKKYSKNWTMKRQKMRALLEGHSL